MAITTYSELKTAVADWLDRSDLTSAIPDFITLAEKTIKREMRTVQEENRAYATTVSGEAEIALPTDFNGMRGCFLRGSTKYALDLVTMDRLRGSWAGSSTGRPIMYAIADEHIVLAPTPDSAYELEMTYYSFSPLSDSNTTNSVLENYPDLYLSLSCMFGYRYISDDAREMKMAQTVDNIITRAIKTDTKVKFGTSPLQIRTS